MIDIYTTQGQAIYILHSKAKFSIDIIPGPWSQKKLVAWAKCKIIFFYFINSTPGKGFTADLSYGILLKTRYKNNYLDHIKDINQVSNNIQFNINKKMLVFVVENILFCNSINITIININIETI